MKNAFGEQEKTSVRGTRAIIDLDAIGRNISGIRTAVGPRTGVMAVVKADGYGHGAVPVSRKALASGADCLAVAIPEEGQELRLSGIDCPILVLGLIQPWEAWKSVDAGLEQTVCSDELLQAVDAESQRHGVTTAIHVKVDTGMGRIGLAPSDVVEFARRVQTYPNIVLKGVYSHLSCADEKDKSFTRTQISRFEDVLRSLGAAGISVPVKHIANSAGVLDFPEAYFDMVRPGIMIYGLYPSQDVTRSVELHPGMSFLTCISHVKRVPPQTPIGYGATFVTSQESIIATIPAGYADGYRRLLSNKATVLLKGHRVPLVGRVAMDMCMLDVSCVPDAKTGDDVVLFGEGLPVEEIASHIGTINYEVVTGIGKRVPRVYV